MKFYAKVFIITGVSLFLYGIIGGYIFVKYFLKIQ